ncbi:cytochrome P450 [Mollisia scopiformis]|uniref:Cytochrome P450 n=1 Tax=Mollisia scopiformis TaxID=149040 RepID=A0A194X738_MOLSC|nr:cytochrome P450 [Mollisia scopiformis]KUJ15899.1 cytochrome P450 [Mollisia scopiformis]
MEPPLAPPKVPLIGHLWGMFRHGGGYYKLLCSKYGCCWPLFSIQIFSTEIYVVNSPELAQAIFRDTKALSFNPFVIEFTRRVMKARDHVMNVISVNDGENDHFDSIHHVTQRSFAHVPAVLETNQRVLNGLARYLNGVDTSGQFVQLFDWIRNAYTVVTAEALYGNVNPISEDPKLVKNIWDFEGGVMTLSLNLFPRLTAPAAWKARKALVPAFIDYYNRGLDQYANSWIKSRAQIGRQDGFTNKDLGSFELTVLYTSIVNTVPNAFSMLCRILREPALTAKICHEVDSIIGRFNQADGTVRVSLNIADIVKQCPILVSTWQENIRFTVNATSVRVVMEDVVIKDKYLLKKGGIVQICGGAIHESTRYWGQDALTFDPYRFLENKDQSRGVKKARSQGLLPFGGGKHLCPGRNLAFVEVVSFLAMLVVGFDIRMKDGSLVQPPPYKKQYVGEASKKPEHDIEVKITRKEAYKDAVFEFWVESSVEVEESSMAEPGNDDPFQGQQPNFEGLGFSLH